MSIDAMKQALLALEWAADYINPKSLIHCNCPVCLASDTLRLAINQAESAVAAEQTAVLQTIEEFMGSEKERHPMFSDGYDYALSHIQQFVKGRQT